MMMMMMISTKRQAYDVVVCWKGMRAVLRRNAKMDCCSSYRVLTARVRESVGRVVFEKERVVGWHSLASLNRFHANVKNRAIAGIRSKSSAHSHEV